MPSNKKRKRDVNGSELSGSKKKNPTDDQKKRESTPKEKDVFGSFPIIVARKTRSYFVSFANILNITLPLMNWLMGNNVKYEPKDIEKAIDSLFERDHKRFLKLLSGDIEVGKFGAIFIPMVFFSDIPALIDTKEFQRRKGNGDLLLMDYSKDGQMQGEGPERKVFQALQAYFWKTGDACLVLRGHRFLYNQNYQEKDFIILNLTKGYVMVIEVKASNNGFTKAKLQLKDSKERVEAVFNSVNGMSDAWQYAGVCYIDAGDCNSTHDFVINGSDQLDFKVLKPK